MNNDKEMREKKDKKVINEQQKKKIIIKAIIVLFFIIFIIVLFCIVHKDKLYGKWTTDGNTVYEFNGKGKGSLTVPSTKLLFSYKISKNKIHIDFIDENAEDGDYEYFIKDVKLTLTETQKTKSEYVFTKVNK